MRIFSHILKSDKVRFWKIVLVVQIIGKRDKFGPKAEYLAF